MILAVLCVFRAIVVSKILDLRVVGTRIFPDNFPLGTLQSTPPETEILQSTPPLRVIACKTRENS